MPIEQSFHGNGNGRLILSRILPGTSKSVIATGARKPGTAGPRTSMGLPTTVTPGIATWERRNCAL
jgi:hypothetical protein